ncbi:hypothetical protein CTI12_AA382140 [Artemisia annua]|uniref:Uncharacterized protein n=1 Tax=Artemisia annua TaxID=35608 RepID=A0A2U1MFA8_ARTAN|nr:hypothetical protein CTI12_AA382140 [Artemisia annua]
MIPKAVKLSSKSNKGFDIVTSKDLEIDSELPKGSSDILGIGTGSLAGKLSISLGLKSISLSPIERVSICSPKGKSISNFSSPKTTSLGKDGEYARGGDRTCALML